MYGNLFKSISLFIKLAEEYSEFRDKIERLSKKNSYPFSDWFDKGNRSYIDFSPSKDIEVDIGDLPDPDWDVKHYLESSNANLKYKVIDYIGGIALDQNGKKVRIGKALNRMEKEEVKALNALDKREMTEEEAEEMKTYKEDLVKQIKTKIDRLRYTFENSTLRSGSKVSNLKIVFSQDPHDVARMSTDRHWESCMTLGTGKHHENIFCEVSTGGIIAYLIKGNDENIEHPIGRIHIRRFDDTLGNSIAIPEKTVYGVDVPGFLEAVQKWVNDKNEFGPGLYEMKGGEYSDTYSQSEVVLPDTEQKILDWINGKNLPAMTKYTEWTVVDEYKDQLEDYHMYDDYGEDEEENKSYEHSFMTELEAQTYINHLNYSEVVDSENEYLMEMSGYDRNEYGELVNPEKADLEDYDPDDDAREFAKNRFSITKNDVNLSRPIREKIITGISRKKINASNEFLKQVKPIIMGEGTYTDISSFIENYTDHITKEDLLSVTTPSLRQVALKLPEGYRKVAFAELEKRTLFKLYTLMKNKDFREIRNDVTLSLTGEFITREKGEKLVEHMMDFLLYMMNDGDNIEIKDVVSIFTRLSSFAESKGIVSQKIIDFYSHLLDSDYVFDTRTHSFMLAGLGKAGTPLLPKLNERRDIVKKQYEEEKNKKQIIPGYSPTENQLNNYNYIIDSIETGEPSKKYSLHRS